MHPEILLSVRTVSITVVPQLKDIALQDSHDHFHFNAYNRLKERIYVMQAQLLQGDDKIITILCVQHEGRGDS